MTENALPELPELEDAPLSPKEILGTHTFEDVLYSPTRSEDLVPVNAVTREKTVELTDTEVAKQFAEQTGDNRVAVPRNTESMAETGGGPYVSTFFADSKVTRGKRAGRDERGLKQYENGDEAYNLEWTYRAAWKSDDYDVYFEADYESGDVTISVEVATDD